MPNLAQRFRLLILVVIVNLCLPSVGVTQDIRAYFSPNGGATDAVVRVIDQAEKEALVLAYSFASAPIAKALVNAHKRGVVVVVILDKSQQSEKYSSLDFLDHAGIPVLIDSEHAIQYNKVVIADRNVLVTGSFNLTKAAEFNNAENLLVIRETQG